MKNLIPLFVFLGFSAVNAGVFLEPLQGSDKIFRGRAPKSTELRQMTKAGITSVLIFKNQTKTEVDDEINQLISAGFNEGKIFHVPFLWKDIASEKTACEQIITSLNILKNVENSADDKILFHCTVGEDRTGLLAGLMSQLLEQEDAQLSFQNQMCAKGYAGGNTRKPPHVSQAVDKYLTPLYYKISQLIETGALTFDKLSERSAKKLCKQIAEIDVSVQFKTCDQPQ